jgi:hypothetical protein
LDTSAELTRETIERCPPSTPPHPLDGVLDVVGIESMDLHRYHARLNLLPGSDREAIGREVARVLGEEWGAASSKRHEPARTFSVPYRGPRIVAESPRMAGSHRVLREAFGISGVAEAVLEPGKLRIRLGRLFSWDEVEDDVRGILRPGPARRIRGGPRGDRAGD